MRFGGKWKFGWRALAAGAAGLAMVGTVDKAAAQAPAKTYTWKLQSTWPQANLLQESVAAFAKSVDEMSAGRLKIEVSPGGQLVPAFEVLDATHKNVIDAAHSWPGYWTGKNTAAGLFGAPPGGPFGLGRDEFISWMLSGGGLDLYNEMLQKELKLNVICLITTTVPYWEAFGWLKKPFENLAELRRIKYRTSGMGLDMLRNMGMTGVQMPGGEVLPALERGTIDGAEWGIPSHDILMGFHNITKYYYMPDMRQPPAVHELLINKSKWDELPPDLKAIVRAASLAEIVRMSAHSIDLDSKAAVELQEKHGVKILRTPDEVFKAQLEGVDKVFEAESAKNPFFAKVLTSMRDFAKRAVPHAARIRPPLEQAVQHYWSK
ncbi:MAG TPA: TRAP transporter substrate-binding protein [Hyphomicrobiaceae bacterium]|nr:TRAP transporter substrate-binding protein [Hyphomicrobiaceae bacterium]